MFTQKIYLAFLLIFLVQSTRIKNGLRFKDLQEKLTVDELESIKYMVQFGKINNIVDLIKKKEGNITISELAEIKGIKKEEEKYNITLFNDSINTTIREIIKPIQNDITDIKREVNDIKKELIKQQIENGFYHYRSYCAWSHRSRSCSSALRVLQKICCEGRPEDCPGVSRTATGQLWRLRIPRMLWYGRRIGEGR